MLRNNNTMENIEKIKEKAEYCLNCKTHPCTNACPMNTHIPEFISKIKNDEVEEAYKILRENNIFSHICSMICPQENQCEGSCVRGIKQTPTQIGNLEKFVNEWAENRKIEIPIINKDDRKEKIAVIGSGPAGLECAYELRKNGFKVTVFEKEKELGGILKYGIPDFRLEKKYVQEIIEILKYIPEESVNKIPREMIERFKTKQLVTYDFKIDTEKTFEEQELLEETKAILANIFRDYWATDYQKAKIIEKENQDREECERQKRERYNPNEIFKNVS